MKLLMSDMSDYQPGLCVSSGLCQRIVELQLLFVVFV